MSEDYSNKDYSNREVQRWGFVLALLCLLFAFSGCQYIEGIRNQFKARTDEALDRLNKKTTEIGEQLEKTKTSVEKKVEDVKNATEEVKEAIDAVKKVTE